MTQLPISFARLPYVTRRRLQSVYLQLSSEKLGERFTSDVKGVFMRTTIRTTALFLASLSIVGTSLPAIAFNPDEGALISPQPTQSVPAHTGRSILPPGIVPKRFYSPDTVISAPLPTASAPIAAAPTFQPPAQTTRLAPAEQPVATALTSKASALRQVPIEQPIVPQEALPATVAVAALEPVAEPYAPPLVPEPQSHITSYDANRFSVGLEGFYDHYEEPDTFPDLHRSSYYGSVDLSYAHYFNSSVYGEFEQRVSYGRDRYKSSQGHIADIPQWETDTRLSGGYDFPMSGGRLFRSYVGVGARYYLDEARGRQTSGGASSYDRRIFQIYAPMGITYEFPAYGLTFAPNLEIDPLLYGNVETRLQNIAGFEEFNNLQHTGFGWRAELMMGQVNPNGFGWQFGPFVRYWVVDDSEIDINAVGAGLEPRNTRIQAGAKLKFLF